MPARDAGCYRSRRLPWVVFLISIGCLLLPHPARQAKARILLLDLFLPGLVISKNPVGRFFLHQLKSSWGFVSEFSEFEFYFRKKSAMAPQRKEGSGKDERADGSDPPLGSDAFEEFREIDGSRPQGTTRTPGGIAERLRDVLRGESDGDLLLERRDVESGVLQWRMFKTQNSESARKASNLAPAQISTRSLPTESPAPPPLSLFPL